MLMAAALPTLLGEITITQAEVADLPTAVALLAEAAARLHERGIQQWASPPPPGLALLLEREVAAGHLYVVRLAATARLIGLFRLRWADAYWATVPGEAGYLHSFALCTDACGYGIGAQLLGWLGDYLRSRHCHYLWLDCVAFNPRLRRYYEEQGFIYCGQVVDGEDTLALYQLTLYTARQPIK